MCEVYVKADPTLYKSRSRSVRIHGVVTTIRLENQFWDVLAQCALHHGFSTLQLNTRLHDEVMEAQGEVENFASFLRVCCVRYLVLVAGKPLAERPLRDIPDLQEIGRDLAARQAGLQAPSWS